MVERIKENFKGNKGIISLIIGVGVLLIIIFGASFAYFSVNSKNNASASNVQGDFATQGRATLNTNTSNLYLNLDGVYMSEENVGALYYANSDSKGTPITNATLGNGIYTLATASIDRGTTKYNCTYKYKITATLKSFINDGSSDDIKIKISGDSILNGSVEYTLKQLVDAGTDGIQLMGIFENLVSGSDQTITIESTVENTNKKQDDFAGNSYTINVEPLPGNEGFSCKIAIPEKFEATGISKVLIDSGNLWQSGLEKDGYRFTGSNPDNYICFGTNDKSECTSNENDYMYRIIGTFTDDSGVMHTKLVKYATLPEEVVWHSSYETDTNWNDSSLKSDINSTQFLTNTTYVPNSTWSNKIANWKWTAVNTKTSESNGANYYNEVSPINIYLHEMNRNAKNITIGKWTNPVAKIGITSVSDYVLSSGESIKNITTGTNTNKTILVSGWMHLSNNIDLMDSGFEWTMARYGQSSGFYDAWYIDNEGYIDTGLYVGSYLVARPTFYLSPSVELQSGTGSINDPYIIKE